MKIYHLPDTPKSLVFDIDLTLYDSRAYHASQRQLLLARLAASLETSVQETEATLRAVRDDFARHNAGRQLSMGNALRALGVSFSTSSQWREELFKPEDFLRPDRALDRTLAKLSATFRLAAVTNNPTSIGERTLLALGVRRHFLPVLGLDRFGVSKPTLVPFQMVAAYHEVSLHAMISVGDRLAVDIELPVAHGMGGILVEGVNDVYCLPEVLRCHLGPGSRLT
jgi:FMN phosphatase YigB (HAD superfamily)